MVHGLVGEFLAPETCLVLSDGRKGKKEGGGWEEHQCFGVPVRTHIGSNISFVYLTSASGHEFIAGQISL